MPCILDHCKRTDPRTIEVLVNMKDVGDRSPFLKTWDLSFTKKRDSLLSTHVQLASGMDGEKQGKRVKEVVATNTGRSSMPGRTGAASGSLCKSCTRQKSSASSGSSGDLNLGGALHASAELNTLNAITRAF